MDSVVSGCFKQKTALSSSELAQAPAFRNRKHEASPGMNLAETDYKVALSLRSKSSANRQESGAWSSLRFAYLCVMFHRTCAVHGWFY